MKKILLILALLPTLIFADAVIFSGNDVKALKQNLDLFGVVKILSGNLDPSVSGLPAPVGSQYNSTNGKVYVKKGVLDTQWEESQTGLINLSSDASGVLPTSNGGTGSSNLGTGVVKASGGSLSSSSVVDADVASNAAIDYSKLASLSTGQVLLGNAGVPTATTLSGGATVGATGVVTLGNSDVITQLLTGYVSSPGTVTSADSIIQAIKKIDGNAKLKLGLTKSDSDGSPVPTTQLNVPNSQLTTSGTNTRRIETGNNNLLANPSFEHSTIGTGWTAVNGSCNSSAGVTMDGLKNCLFTSSGTNWSLSQCSTTNAPRLAGQEMENSIWLGSASTTDPIWVCPGTNGVYPTPSVDNGCMRYTNIGNIQPLKNYFLGDYASTSNCIRISGSNSGTTVGIDKAYTGLRTNSEVSGELNTPWQDCTFSTLTWQGLGTISSNGLRCRRNGPNLEITGGVQVGTVSSSTALIPLPTNYGNISIGLGGTFVLGEYIRNATTVGKGGFALALTGTDRLYIRLGASATFSNSSNSAALPETGSNLFGNGEIFFPKWIIPIAEWQNNINAFSTKCDDPRQCETEFTVSITGTPTITSQAPDNPYGWISSVSISSNVVTVTYNPTFASTLTLPMACEANVFGSDGFIEIVTSTTSSMSYRARSDSGVLIPRPVNISCNKQGVDADKARITQQIVQMREVPRTPGAVRTDIFGVRYTGGGATTACSVVGACTLLNPIGNSITSIAKTGTGNYLVTFSKNYNTVSCTYTPTGATYLGGQINAFTSGTNTLSIQSGVSGGSAQDSFGTINCIGEY